MGRETESVREFLINNNEDLILYFVECKKEGKLPNYSEFCRKYLNGETKEGISFNSIKIKRRFLTNYIRSEYRLWSQLN